MTQTSDFTRSRVGDRCYSPFGPECEVGETNARIVEISGGSFIAGYNDNCTNLFYTDGRSGYGSTYPLAFHTRPAIEIPPPPKRIEPAQGETKVSGFINMRSCGTNYFHYSKEKALEMVGNCERFYNRIAVPVIGTYSFKEEGVPTDNNDPPKRMKEVEVEIVPYGENGIVAGIIVDPKRPLTCSTGIGPVQTVKILVEDSDD